jgi:hypothetical protein
MIQQTAEPIDDGKAEAEPGAPLGLRDSQLVVLAKNIVLLLFRNTGTAIADVYAQPLTPVAAADCDASALRLTHRIGHKIQQDPLQ